VIPQAYLNQWATRAPWPQQHQVEQDLVLSRLIEIAQHELLGAELAFRGGTCLHKLHLPKQLRYSEDLDYVRSTHSSIKPYLSALRESPAPSGWSSTVPLRVGKWFTSPSMPRPQTPRSRFG
jgi:hypothetical protein